MGRIELLDDTDAGFLVAGEESALSSPRRLGGREGVGFLSVHQVGRMAAAVQAAYGTPPSGAGE